ncbi:cytochrome P450 4p1-like [Drosophila tropicalis]|uniref:cytochrome P450 4p1-like n=1 Tax=Drosophila tropicalis TaxID=46794 RepID=UPI0035ABFD8D
MFTIWLTFAFALFYWLYRVNKNYHVLGFFAKRVYTQNGKPVESLVAVPQGLSGLRNLFANFGKDNASVFTYLREISKRMGYRSYVQYGMGRTMLSVVDAEYAEIVLNDQNLINKGLVYTFMEPALKNGLLIASGQKWHSRRKMLTPTFHFNIMGQFQEVFKTESLKFVQPFLKEEEIDITLNDIIPRFTLNTICETAMGIKLDDMAEEGDRYRNSFSKIDQCFARRLTNPFLWNRKIYDLIAAKDYEPHLKEVHRFSSEIIAKRKVLFEKELEQRHNRKTTEEDLFINKKQRYAMLDTLLCAESDGLIDHAGICEEVDTLMFAGYDTTSMGLIFGLMNMSVYPELQDLCFKEIEEYVDDDFNNLDSNLLGKLKHLECFVKETMRMYPSVPIISRKTIQDTTLSNGLVLPKNTDVTLLIFDILRNPKHWDSPDEFKPERFLPENSQNRPTYAFVPFSAGQRNCIGQKYAMQEMKTLMVVILKRFKILPLVDPKTLVFNVGITLRTKTDIKVKLVRRK